MLHLSKPLVGAGSLYALFYTHESMISWHHDVYFKLSKQQNRTLTRRQLLVCNLVFFNHCLSHLIRHFPSMVYAYKADQEKRVNTLFRF